MVTNGQPMREVDETIERNGQSMGKADESIGSTGQSIESIGKPGRSMGRIGESMETNGQPIGKAGESMETNGQPMGEAGESMETNGRWEDLIESIRKPGQSMGRIDESRLRPTPRRSAADAGKGPVIVGANCVRPFPHRHHQEETNGGLEA